MGGQSPAALCTVCNTLMTLELHQTWLSPTELKSASDRALPATVCTLNLRTLATQHWGISQSAWSQPGHCDGTFRAQPGVSWSETMIPPGHHAGAALQKTYLNCPPGNLLKGEFIDPGQRESDPGLGWDRECFLTLHAH